MDTETCADRLESAVIVPRLQMHRNRFVLRLSADLLTRDEYVRYLTETYHYVKHSTRLLAAAACRLPASNRALFARLMEYSREESGCDDWLLEDLSALGADPDTAVCSSPSAETEAMFALQYYLIEHETPLALLGYMYALETLSSQTAAHFAAMLKRVLKLGDDGLRFLVGHGEVDVGHVDTLRHVLNEQIKCKQEEAVVIRSAVATLKCYGHFMEACAVPERQSQPRSAGWS
jgi:pyrroloquinoline quinone (PQQ) biosynthesis protein C